MGKRRKGSDNKDSGAPAPKRARIDAGAIVFSTPELLALILAHVVCGFAALAQVSAIAIGNYGDGGGTTDKNKRAAQDYITACETLGQFLVLFSTVGTSALAAARSVRLPAQCGFHMRQDIKDHQFRAFLQGWTPEFTNNSVVLTVHFGCALVSLRAEIDYCTVNNIELVFKRLLKWGIFEPTYLSISSVREGVLAYQQEDYKMAAPILIQASHFYYDEYTSLLCNIMDNGSRESHHNDVYAKLALRWLRDRENQDLSRDARNLAYPGPTNPYVPDMTLPPRIRRLIK